MEAPDTHPRSDEPDRLEEETLPPPSAPFPDPVLRVRELPRLRLGGRRFTGRIDNALVCVPRKGPYETFLPPARPTTLRRYTVLYEVNTEAHSFRLREQLPSQVDSFAFEAVADITWRVADPARFVTSQERNVPGLLIGQLVPLMRTASRGYAIADSSDAEQAVQRAVDSAAPIGVRQGLRATVTVRLRRDTTERTHQERLRTARHEAEAAAPEHTVSIQRQRHEAHMRAERIKFYEDCLARGGTAALALHLTEHPEDTGLVLQHLGEERRQLIETRGHLIDRVLDKEGLESYQMQEPRELTAKWMTTVLKSGTTPEDQTPGTSP
ncbi:MULTISPECIES: hypothetical protein [Streptomyces]|jgi:hypothetical protein|uniref:Band 7 domain-containing protein n=1 Tax=Streptomyces bottropensis ATCC 25435 TaxID=1054862 RepID=M3EFD5_9ACTN|nr:MULTISPECIES: hypothetical protein [Streptomyces]EMF54936.1 hypothetical protein SBD_4604 [Streptomyces bottropensis ATCC 25435]MZD20198.1 hypothetical protein [Streptomyces sp. SID5476]